MKFSTVHANNPTKAARDLNAGLAARLAADAQFNCFVVIVNIDAGAEVKIPNRLRDVGGNSIIPGEWSVIDAAGASAGAVGRGSTKWTKDFLYIQNNSERNGQFRIRFLERPQRDDDASTERLVAPEQPAADPDAATLYGVFSYTGNQTIPTNSTSWTTVTIDAEDADPADLFSIASNEVTAGRTGTADMQFYISDLEATAYLGVNLRLYDVTAAAVVFTYKQYQIDTDVANAALWPRRRASLTAGHAYRMEWKTDASGTTAAARGAVEWGIYYV